MKVSPTEKAIQLIIERLIKFKKEGFDPNESLRLSIENSWRGVFAANNKNSSIMEELKEELSENNENK